MINKFLTSLSNGACVVAKNICLVSMIILTPVVFANIISRFVFGYSIAWSSEVARYAFIWLTFMGMAVALREGSHAQIDLLIQKLSPNLRKPVLIAGHIIVVILSLFLIFAGTRQTIAVWDVQAAYMRFLSMSWMYVSIPVSGLFMLFFSMSALADTLTGKNNAPGESR